MLTIWSVFHTALSASLFEDGYTDITNIDVSSVIIEQMRQKYPHMECILSQQPVIPRFK